MVLNFAPQPAPVLPERPRFAWPAVGPLSNKLTAKHPLGIDVGLALFPASNVLASGDGRVSFAGGTRCCGYGLHVIIDHGDGLTSLYAHLSQLAVQEGDDVKQGRAVGISGNTGRSTSEHLHFEIRLNGEVQDPLAYLPRPEMPRWTRTWDSSRR